MCQVLSPWDILPSHCIPLLASTCNTVSLTLIVMLVTSLEKMVVVWFKLNSYREASKCVGSLIWKLKNKLLPNIN